MRVRVPRDRPTLAAALATGADRIVLQGVVELPPGAAGAILSRPVHISGGTLRAHGEWALVVGEGVRLSGVRIENPEGHGVRLVAGAPVLEDLELEVQGVAGVCEGHARPVLRRVVVDGAENGWLLREDTAPDGDELAVRARGSAVVVADRAAGHLARLALMSGDRFACVEAHGQSRTTFSGLTVLSAGCGALHVYGESRVSVQGGHIQASGTADGRYPAIEVRERAAPTVAELVVDQSGGRGFFVHGEARPTLRSVRVAQAAGNGVEVQGSVVLDVDGLTLSEIGGGGVVLRGEVTGRLRNVATDATANVGFGIGGAAKVEVDGLTVRGAHGAGLRVAGSGRGVVRRARLELLGCPGVWVHEAGRVTLDAPTVCTNRADGLKVEGDGTVVVRGGRIAGNEGRGVAALEGARLRLDGVAVEDNQGWAIEAAGRADVRWSGGALPSPHTMRDGGRITQAADDALPTASVYDE